MTFSIFSVFSSATILPSFIGDKIPYIDNLLRVETVCRLVENDNLGIADDGSRDADSLLIALGEIFYHAVFDIAYLYNLAYLIKMLFFI